MTARPRIARPEWYGDVAEYQRPDVRKAVFQVVNTLVPYGVLWAVMVRAVQTGVSYWITLALAVVAAGFLVRTFIIFHDCGHGSFFASRRANTIVGYITGILAFVPYEQWRHSHGVHHATVGNLDRRGTGDVFLMTVEEYRAASWFRRAVYRVYEHPLLMFVVGPLFAFLVGQRFARPGAKGPQRFSVWFTNLAILTIVLLASAPIGLRTYVLVQLPIIWFATMAGVWLFYVQHHFEDMYWARHEVWDPWRAALEGSSYYKLPKLLQWITGNIGLHHIHHVRPRIPNYELQRCYDEVPAMQAVKPLTLGESLKTMWYALYDEEAGQLIRFRDLKAVS